MELGNQLLTPNNVLALNIEQRVSIKASRPVIKYAQATISYLQSWSNKNKKTNLHVCIQSMIYTLQKRNFNQNYVHLNNIHTSDIKSSSVLLNSSCFDV